MKTMDAVTSAKTAGGVAVATVSTGAGSWLDVIPDDIGKLAALVGMALSFTLIVVHIRRDRRESKRLEHDLKKSKDKAE